MSSTKLVTENTKLKYLTNAELREGICHMAGVTPEKEFNTQKRNTSRRYSNREKVGIIMHLLQEYEYEVTPLNGFVEEAIEEKLQRCTVATLIKILDKLAILELDKRDNNVSKLESLNRRELKALYRYLEEYNNGR